MAASKKRTNQENSTTEESEVVICIPDREAKISELAYLKAESRGFEPGHEFEDWMEAEQEFML